MRHLELDASHFYKQWNIHNNITAATVQLQDFMRLHHSFYCCCDNLVVFTGLLVKLMVNNGHANDNAGSAVSDNSWLTVGL